MLTRYETSSDFVLGTENHPEWIKSAYARYNRGIRSSSPLLDLFLDGKKSLISSALSSLPVLGSIRGLARLYSIYSVKDRSEDSKKNTVFHTIASILEILGLGIFMLIAKILILSLINAYFLY
ncbi:hypothetical protein C834K_0598 [Chlamydia poikilotherma]|uniref:Uncharacterized protein n=1 Tax=Chlamydia poikilotherma TaxID=1967783 RepID=A0A3B0QGX5_9CHLA|nr:hypothetical protein [Chlamydia poikilotherma]SYX09052.1 hypothetical protein C834K_0598 [Chlamydia poikilotherma]